MEQNIGKRLYRDPERLKKEHRRADTDKNQGGALFLEWNLRGTKSAGKGIDRDL